MFGEDLRYWKNHSQDVSTPVQLLEMHALFLRIILRKTASHFLLEMLALFLRIVPRKTAPHFCWKCLLFFYALSRAKPLLTFAGNAG
ncbi:hypothetical protein [Brucella intermedia]|uniref:hypothetical protein n=1 Tax=Brucella intermedia TaxID=94625 RepID=UPI00124EF799|nr:hypothetical protein [Brucella intermedia]KAB2697404.1 hypothetical protein F9K72_04570 [Brucella intermedia]KAB2712095.1 hypothetical protein F9K80_05860 [Brucella intermedia]NVM42635.1 hypothetical protein [Brucella intermedia]